MIGIDIEKTARFEHFLDNGLKRIFSPEEIEYAKKFENKEEHLCGFFCVKEALVKALNDDELVYSQISVVHEENGKPYVMESDYIKSVLEKHNKRKIDVSISHCKDTAAAVVLVLWNIE